MNKTEIKLYCYFAYLGPFWLIGLFGGGIANKTLRYHINQGIALFLCEILMAAAVFLLYLIGGKIGVILALIAGAAAVGVSVWLSVKGMLNVYNGYKHRITILGLIEFVPEKSRN